MPVNGLHDFGGRMRAGHSEDARMSLPDDIALRSEATGDDDLAVLRERFADGVERFLDRFIDEAASVDDDEIGVLVTGSNEIPFGTQLRQDPFRIDQRLRATEGDETDLGDLPALAAGALVTREVA